MVEGTDEPLHCGVGVVSRHHDEVDDPRVAWARAWSNRDVEERVWIQRDLAGVPLRRVSHGPPNGLLAALVEGGHLGLCGERLLVVVEELVLLRRVHRLVAADVDYRAPDVVGRAAAVQQRQQHGRQLRHLSGRTCACARRARSAGYRWLPPRAESGGYGSGSEPIADFTLQDRDVGSVWNDLASQCQHGAKSFSLPWLARRRRASDRNGAPKKPRLLG